MDEMRLRVKRSLENEESRYAYADTVTNAFVAAQIKALREDRSLSQEELAELIGTKQSGISRLERADYSSWKVETLRKLARAFRVRLRIRFEGFGTLLDEVGGFDDENLLPPKFEDDPAFKEATKSEMEEIAAIAPPITEPVTAVTPTLGDLLSAVANQNADLKKAWSDVALGVGPVLAALESQPEWARTLSGIFTENIKPLLAGIEDQKNPYLTALHHGGNAFPSFFPSWDLANTANINPYLMALERGATAAYQRGQVDSIDTGRSRNKFSKQGRSRIGGRSHRTKAA